jgi:hypothetical protein
MNASLLRAVLTHVEDHPGQFDTTTYGELRPAGGIAADIAGRALLLSGWTLVADSTFRSPDGTRVISGPADIEFEAQALLGLSDDELWDNGDLDNLFDLPARDAVTRLRELAEQAEAVRVNG